MSLRLGLAEVGKRRKSSINAAKLAEANDLKITIDNADFNNPAKLGSDKEMVARLSKTC